MAKTPGASFRCIACETSFPLEQPIYACTACGSLLEVHHRDPQGGLSASQWKERFEHRRSSQPGPDGSGVWRFREWVLPDLPVEDIVTLGEGATPLSRVPRWGETLGIELSIKQCGHTLTGSFKDLGMTVLVTQVHHLHKRGTSISAVACASTGDTSAALAAYGAAAGLRTLVFLPAGKITAAQLVQPLAHGARVLAIDTDFDGCMAHVTRLCQEEGVYLANSKNSLRIEGQKTVAFEIAQGLGWRAPDWIAIPGGNLGNVSAVVKGFEMLRDAGLIDRIPRVLCAQARAADPLYRSFVKGFAPLEPLTASPTAASAIRIGNPVSFPKAVAALERCGGVVASVTEEAIAEVAREIDTCGLYICPHTAVAMAAVREAVQSQTIAKGQEVVVISTAHGLKFTEFKVHNAPDPISVPNDYQAVVQAALA